jgi:hypothetical protein
MNLQIVRVLWSWDLRSVDLGDSRFLLYLFFVLQQEITARAYHSDCCATRTFLWFLAIRPRFADSPLPVVPVPARRTGVPYFTQRYILTFCILMK